MNISLISVPETYHTVVKNAFPQHVQSSDDSDEELLDSATKGTEGNLEREG